MAKDRVTLQRRVIDDRTSLPNEVKEKSSPKSEKRHQKRGAREDNPGWTRPPFTLKEVREAIPSHCFQRSALRGGLYVMADLTGVVILLYLATYIDIAPLSKPLYWAAWALYWWVQGVVMTGLWVLAHECGHQAFSPSKAINDTVGLIIHTMLLVPYFSWRISHGKHHSNTGHMTNDENYLPSKKSKAPWLNRHKIAFSAPAIVIKVIIVLLIAWPLYLMFNAQGRKYGRHTDHFNPWSPLFKDSDRKWVIITDLALLAWIGVLYYLCSQTSFGYVFKMYGAPYLFVNMWLVLITKLQHSDADVPHYEDEEWTWLRGALCTVDRDYGIYKYFHHHIADTHVCHHLFSTIPFYHAQEATEAIKGVIGQFYRKDDSRILRALWNTYRECGYVEDEDKIAFYKSPYQF